MRLQDCKNLEGVEHRQWHNLYGIYMQRATAEGLTLRSVHLPRGTCAPTTNRLAHHVSLP